MFEFVHLLLPRLKQGYASDIFVVCAWRGVTEQVTSMESRWCAMLRCDRLESNQARPDEQEAGHVSGKMGN